MDRTISKESGSMVPDSIEMEIKSIGRELSKRHSILILHNRQRAGSWIGQIRNEVYSLHLIHVCAEIFTNSPQTW